MQTKDYRELPGGYGYGSSTLAKWIQKNLDQDAEGVWDDRFPKHWGPRPGIETMDIVKLPGGYGEGSSTLKHWI